MPKSAASRIPRRVSRVGKRRGTFHLFTAKARSAILLAGFACNCRILGQYGERRSLGASGFAGRVSGMDGLALAAYPQLAHSAGPAARFSGEYHGMGMGRCKG